MADDTGRTEAYGTWLVRQLRLLIVATRTSERIIIENARAITSHAVREMLEDGAKVARQQGGALQDLLRQLGGESAGPESRIVAAMIDAYRERATTDHVLTREISSIAMIRTALG